MPNIILPPHIQRLISPSGVHRRGVKALFYGGPGAGKSFAAATFPGPRCHLNIQEGGINPYASPDDIVLDINTMEQYISVIKWLCEPAQQSYFQSVIVDPGSGIWSIYLEEEEAKHGEIGNSVWPWARLKREWKRVMYLALRARWNFIWTAHVKDTVFDRVPGAPGEKAKMEPRTNQKIPEGEKKIPYIMDWEFLVELQRDTNYLPTGKHAYTLTKVRRPASVDPSELFIGKKWIFDDRKPQGFYEPVILPFREALDQGAVDHLGTDLEVEVEVLEELEETYQANEVGVLQRKLSRCRNAADYSQVAQECRVVEPNLDTLSRNLLRQSAAEARKRIGLPEPK